MSELPSVDEPDAEREQRLGTRAALLSLWNPDGRPVTVAWDDSRVITADVRTRARLAHVHSVVHAFLRGQPEDGMRRAADMSSLMRAFAALRSLTLTSELLWKRPPSAWEEVLTEAASQIHAVAEGEPLRGAESIATSIAENLIARHPQTILDCVASVAAELPPEARCGLGGYGAAVLAAALKADSHSTFEEIQAEHVALIVALTQGGSVTYRDGHLILGG